MPISLSRNQMIGVGVGVVILLGIGLALFMKSNKQDFQETQTVCKRLNGNDVIFYKLETPELDKTIRKINWLQMESFIDAINTDLAENKLLQQGYLTNSNAWRNPNYDRNRFKNNFNGIRNRYERISTLCTDEIKAKETNMNASKVVETSDASIFLNHLNNYLNNILFPYIQRNKLADGISDNDIFTDPVPQTFSEYYKEKTGRDLGNNYLTSAVARAQSQQQDDANIDIVRKPMKDITAVNFAEVNSKIEELRAKINSANVDQINAQLEEIKKQLIAIKNSEIKDQEEMKKQKNMYLVLFVAVIVLLAVLYVKK
jgi:hypothetical protein